MKIRNRHLLRAAGWLATRAAFGLVRTLRFDFRCLGTTTAPLGDVPPGSRYVFAVWHENILVPPIRLRHPDVAVLVSKHADGQLLGALITALGMGLVHGSTNRGGVEAVRQLVHGTAGRRHLVVTPDGPRGPRRVVQPGVVYIASRTGMQIVPVGVGYDRPWRAGSWDRFAVPKPCSRARTIFGEPITVPPKLRTEELDGWRLVVQSEIDRLSAAAERWAETSRFDLPPPAPAGLRLAS